MHRLSEFKEQRLVLFSEQNLDRPKSRFTTMKSKAPRLYLDFGVSFWRQALQQVCTADENHSNRGGIIFHSRTKKGTPSCDLFDPN
jgi:hypothetical protein